MCIEVGFVKVEILKLKYIVERRQHEFSFSSYVYLSGVFQTAADFCSPVHSSTPTPIVFLIAFFVLVPESSLVGLPFPVLTLHRYSAARVRNITAFFFYTC